MLWQLSESRKYYLWNLNIGIFIIVYLLYCVLSLCFSFNVVNAANVHNTANNSNSAPVIAEVKKEISTETIKGNVYSKFLVQNFAKSVQIPYHICKKTKLVLTNGKEGRRTCDYYYTEQRVLIVENGAMGRRIQLQSNMDPGF